MINYKKDNDQHRLIISYEAVIALREGRRRLRSIGNPSAQSCLLYSWNRFACTSITLMMLSLDTDSIGSRSSKTDVPHFLLTVA